MTEAILPSDTHLDLIFHALANRTRRALVAMLASGPAMVTELARPFSMSLNAVSKHLIVLERAGLIKRSIKGRIHSCALDASAMMTAEQWLSTYEGMWNSSLDNLAAFVENDTNFRTKA